MSGITNFIGNLFGSGSSDNSSPKMEARPGLVTTPSSSPFRSNLILPSSSPSPIRTTERVDSPAISIAKNSFVEGFTAGGPKVYSGPLREASQIEEERDSFGTSLSSSVIPSFVDRDIFHFDTNSDFQSESQASPVLHTTVPSSAPAPSFTDVSDLKTRAPITFSDFYPQTSSSVSSSKRTTKPSASNLNKKVKETVLTGLKSLSGISPLSSTSLSQNSLTSDSSGPSSFSSSEDDFVNVDLKSPQRESLRSMDLRKSPVESSDLVQQGSGLEDSTLLLRRSPLAQLRTSPIDENGQETELVLKSSPISDSASNPSVAVTTGEVGTGMRRSGRVFANLNFLQSFQPVAQSLPVQQEDGLFEMDDL